MSVNASGRARGSGLARTAAHAAGNVLLGIALGLGVYYGLTDLSSAIDQRSLAAALPAAVASPHPDTLLAGSPGELDFGDWATLDKAYWDRLEEGGVFGRIVAPSVELDSIVVKGHSRGSLKKGPGWIAYTDLPGPTGNCGIAGHRTTYGAPFRHIDGLSPGDTIDLYSPYRRYRYEVSDTQRVTPDRVDVMDTTAEPVLTLSACDPPFSARYRLIVRADLVEVRRIEAE